MTQVGIEDAVGQQLFDMPDALISRALELFQCQAGRTIGLIELLRTSARVPLRIERRKLATDFLEAHAIRTLVGAGIVRKLDRASRDDGGYDLRQIPNAVIVGGLADVKRLIEYIIGRRFECSDEGARDILDMHDRPPGRAI